MNRMLAIFGLLILSRGMLPASAAAGGTRVAQPAAAGPVIVENYYKLTPGGTSEWLALFRKNHHPILQQFAKDGLLTSEKLYERRFHAASPPWDYKVVLVWRDWAALEEAHRREPDVARSLYPNKADHDREEKRRWELTVEHWDDVLSQVPLE